MSTKCLFAFIFLIFQFRIVLTQNNINEQKLNTLDKIERYRHFQKERDKMLNTDLPKFSGKDFISDAVIDEHTFQDKILLLNFGNSSEYCFPVEFQHEELNVLQNNIDTSLVQIIAIYSGDEIELYKNREVDQDGFPILILEKYQIESLFKINVYPTTFLVDKNGMIREVLKNSSWNILEKEIQKLNIIWL